MRRRLTPRERYTWTRRSSSLRRTTTTWTSQSARLVETELCTASSLFFRASSRLRTQFWRWLRRREFKDTYPVIHIEPDGICCLNRTDSAENAHRRRRSGVAKQLQQTPGNVRLAGARGPNEAEVRRHREEPHPLLPKP